MTKSLNTGNGIMGSMIKNSDPNMVWLRVNAEDNEFYHMANTIVKDLEAENKRLREALESIVNDWDSGKYVGLSSEHYNLAKQALQYERNTNI